MSRVTVTESEQLTEGERLFVEVADKELCLFRIDGAVYCIENSCPHRGGEVGKGEISPEITIEEDDTLYGREEVFADDIVITCPWHGWEFHIDSGCHAGDAGEEFSLNTFDVVEEDGHLYLDL